MPRMPPTPERSGRVYDDRHYIPPLTGQSLGTPPTLTVTALTPNPAGGSLEKLRGD